MGRKERRRERTTEKTGRWRRFMPTSYRGLMFDLAVIAANVFLARLLTRHVGRLLALSFLDDDPQAAHTFLLIMLAASAAQTIGALLKRRPLQTRLAVRGDARDGPFGCFLVIHLALMLVTGAMIVALAGVEPKPAVTVTLMVVCIAQTVLVLRAMSPYGKTPPAPDWRNSRGAEFVADVCLFGYMLVNLAIWNTVTGGSNARAAGVGDFFERALGFVILSPVILLFYIPPRLLFLVEDYRYRATWITMTLAVAPVAYRFILGTAKTDW